jgi:hypothetical protein
MEITFTETLGTVPKEYYPTPASKKLPEWYQKMTRSYPIGALINEAQMRTNATIKKCMPVFDSMTAGYLFYTPADVYVTQKDGLPFYEWVTKEPIAFHPIEQAPTHPTANGAPYPKWLNSFSIKTPKGYSVLITAPKHRDSVFTILDAIVDTDTYHACINFPFVLNDVKFEGYIPAGTPLAQIIPFKRESWKMKMGSEKELKQHDNVKNLLHSHFHGVYKRVLRSKKEFV